MNARVGLLFIGISLAACGGTPSPPVVPDGEYEYEFKHSRNGQQLDVRGKSYTYTSNERVEVAEREIYDSQGRRVGSDRIYANQQVARRGYSWGVYQGTEQIDVLSALHIARDEQFKKAFNLRVDQINEDRENALAYYENAMKVTAGTRTLGLGLGIAGVVAGAAMLIAGAAVTPDGESPGAVWIYVPTGLFIVGGVGFGIVGGANGRRTAAAAKAQAMANSQVSESDFGPMATESYVANAADRYNSTIAGPSSPPPAPGKNKNKKKKKSSAGH